MVHGGFQTPWVARRILAGTRRRRLTLQVTHTPSIEHAAHAVLLVVI